MNLKHKLYPFLIAFLLIFLVQGNRVVASTPELTLYPESGWIEYGEDFVLDVLVDTKEQEVVLVRAVLTFDTKLVKVKSAVRNEEIFCDWPEAEQLIDNDEGIVMATGFCQSGVDDLYATSGEPDTFVRITFETIAEGTLAIDWEYSGRDEPMKTVIMNDGSPPQNLLTTNPASRDNTYTISPREEPRTPDAGLPIFENISSTFLFGGSVFVLAFVANVLLDPKRRYFNKSRTVVIYNDDKK
jgi:hypothetical protein